MTKQGCCLLYLRLFIFSGYSLRTVGLYVIHFLLLNALHNPLFISHLYVASTVGQVFAIMIDFILRIDEYKLSPFHKAVSSQHPL